MGLTQIYPSGLRYSKKNGWSGYVSYITEEGNEQAYCRSLMGAVYANISGDEAPVVINTEAVWQPEGVPGVSMIRAYYETPRVVGKARLTMSGAYGYRLPEADMIVDLDGEIVKGPDAHKGIWVPLVKSGPYPIIVLRTASESVNVAATLGYVGSMNSSGHSYIFGADAKQLYMLKIDMDWEHGGDVVYLDYYMAFNLDGWDTVVESQRGVYIVSNEEVYAMSSTGFWEIDSDENERKVLKFVPTKQFQTPGSTTIVDSVSEPRRMIEKKSWSNLASLVVW